MIIYLFYTKLCRVALVFKPEAILIVAVFLAWTMLNIIEIINKIVIRTIIFIIKLKY